MNEDRIEKQIKKEKLRTSGGAGFGVLVGCPAFVFFLFCCIWVFLFFDPKKCLVSSTILSIFFIYTSSEIWFVLIIASMDINARRIQLDLVLRFGFGHSCGSG